MAEHDWLVVTGAASGIMEAGHVGAGRENSMGLNIMLPFEQYGQPGHRRRPQARAHEVLLHAQADVREGVRRGRACCPAASARSTKALEVLTLLQTGKRDMVPVVFLDAPGGDFWQRLAGVRRRAAARRTA